VTSPADDILRALDSPDEENRRRALFLAAERRDERALPKLQQMAAEDPSLEVRYYARKALLYFQQVVGVRRTAGGGGVEELEGDLSSPDPRVRNEAVQALVRLGGDAARTRVRTMVEGEVDPFVRATLAVSLGVLGGPAEISSLDSLLQDSDPRVRANAIEGLMHIGGADVPARVVPYLKDADNRVKVNAYTALGKFKKMDLLKALGEMLTSDKAWRRDAAAYALVKMEIPESVPLLEYALGDDYVGIRLKARNGLVLLARREVTQATQVLGRLAGERPYPEGYLSLDMLQVRDRPEVRRDEEAGRLALIRRIVEAQDREKISMLLRQLTREKRPRVLATLLTAVGNLGSPEALPALRPFLESPDRRIRANAVEAWGMLGADAEVGALDPFRRDPDNRVRANAVVALGRRRQDVRADLEAMADDTSEPMRLSAVYALVELGRDEAVPLLSSLLLDPATSVKKKAIDGLRILASDGRSDARKALEDAGLPAGV
jgi:HEAT repeat protein